MADEKENDPDDKYTVREGDLLLVDKDGNPMPTPKKKNVTLHIYLPEDGGDEAMS